MYNLVEIIKGNASNIQEKINTFLENTEHNLLDIKLIELTSPPNSTPPQLLALIILQTN